MNPIQHNNIGLFFGSFNPIHIGHLILAEEVREKLGLSRVLFIPTYLPPHKNGAEVAPADDRLAMVRAAIEGNPNLGVDDEEIKRGGRSYTIDTLKDIRKRFTREELFFITGSDLLTYLEEWKDVAAIIGMVTFIVATRPGYPLEKIPSYIQTVAIRAVDVSAYEIRQRIRGNKSFRYLVPERVYEYIIDKELYR